MFSLSDERRLAGHLTPIAIGCEWVVEGGRTLQGFLQAHDFGVQLSSELFPVEGGMPHFREAQPRLEAAFAQEIE